MTQPTETEAQWIARKYYEALTGSSTGWAKLTAATQEKYVTAVQILIDDELIRAAYSKIAFDQSQVDVATQQMITDQVTSKITEAVQSANIDDDTKAAVLQELDTTEA